MTASLLTPAQSSTLAALPLLSARVLKDLLENLYAEPGYSCHSAADIAKNIDVPVSKVKGAVSSLVQKGLVEAVEMQANDEMLPLLYSDLHRDYRADGSKVDGDALKAEALAALDARIAVYTTELAGLGGEVDKIVRAKKDDAELEALAMIAIFGRKAGLGWPVIVKAMGEKITFTHRLRPVMKKLDPSSVAKMGPAYASAYREA